MGYMYWKCKEEARRVGVGGKWVRGRGGDEYGYGIRMALDGGR